MATLFSTAMSFNLDAIVDKTWSLLVCVPFFFAISADAVIASPI